MKLLMCMIVLEFATMLAFGQDTHQSRPGGLPKRPVAQVQSLYSQVVTRHPLGIPEGADMKILAPYLSKALQHRIHVAGACYDDWMRQHPSPNLKPPFGWLEGGIFSGDDEKASPS